MLPAHVKGLPDVVLGDVPGKLAWKRVPVTSGSSDAFSDSLRSMQIIHKEGQISLKVMLGRSTDFPGTAFLPLITLVVSHRNKHGQRRLPHVLEVAKFEGRANRITSDYCDMAQRG